MFFLLSCGYIKKYEIGAESRYGYYIALTYLALKRTAIFIMRASV